MSNEKWSAEKYVQENIEPTGKGYKCPLPAIYVYPNGPVYLHFGKGGFNVPERMQELLDAINTEVARREAEKGEGT